MGLPRVLLSEKLHLLEELWCVSSFVLQLLSSDRGSREWTKHGESKSKRKRKTALAVPSPAIALDGAHGSVAPTVDDHGMDSVSRSVGILLASGPFGVCLCSGIPQTHVCIRDWFVVGPHVLQERRPDHYI